MSRPAKPAETVACPKCKRKQAKQAPDTIYCCDWCRCLFDGDVNEGGDYDDRDPSRRMQRAEAAAERRNQRRPR